jgi:hypothetical protein
MTAMTTRFPLIAAALASVLAAPLAAYAADAAHPTVVELFQSQGCSSCPPANANLLALSNRTDILPLSFQVTYWDQLGWKDTFATPAYTARQWDYAHGLNHSEVWTPQVVVNGRVDVVGVKHGEIEGAIVQGDRGVGGPAVTIAGDRVTVSGAAPKEAATVWLVRYDPAVIQVPIQRGENGGRTLPHKNVVRQLVKLGAWDGVARAFTLPAPDRAGLKTAVLVQEGRGGAILAAARA